MYLSVKIQLNTMNNTVPDCCTKFGINIDIYKCSNKMPKLCIITSVLMKQKQGGVDWKDV